MPGKQEPLWRRYLRFFGPDVSADVDEELRFHLEMRERSYLAQGYSPEEARLAAQKRFGNFDEHRRALREQDGRRLRRNNWAERLGDWMADLRRTVRGLLRQPGFTAVAVLTLGLGIGATATMFSIIDRLLLRPPPHVLNAGRLTRVYLERTGPGGAREATAELNIADLDDLRRATRSFAQVAAFQGGYESILGRGDAAIHLATAIATHDFFPMLGVRPRIGRFFSPEEDRSGSGARVVLLGSGLWKRQFGSDPGIVGRSLVLNGVSHTVIGVLPRDFTGVDLSPVDLWKPMAVWADDVGDLGGQPWRLARGWSGIYLVGRLNAGIDRAAAEAEATLAWTRGTAGTPSADSTARIRLGSVIAARGLDGPVPEARIALWLGGVTVLVLLIAMSNVTSLLLSRAAQRRREVAVRLALGVSRGRLARGLVTEATVLALAGAAVAVVIAVWGAEAIRAVLLPQLAAPEQRFDLRVFGLAVVAALVAGVGAAIVPALSQGRTGLADALRVTVGDPPARSRTRSAFVLVQTTLTVMLLAGAGLFIRSLHGVRTLDIGLQPDRVLIAYPRFGESDAPTHARRMAVLGEALRRLSGEPGIRSAAITSNIPFKSSTGGMVVQIPGRDSVTAGGGGPFLNAVSRGYFGTVGTPLLSGREFTEADRAGAAPVVVFNETMARLLVPGGNAVGQCVQIEHGPSCWTVVGVVADGRVRRFDELPQPQLFVPADQWDRWASWPQALVVRTAGNPIGQLGAVRRALLAASPSVEYVDVSPLSVQLEPQLRPFTLGAMMFSVFGLLALVIAGVGLYGVLAHSVARRQREMGVRLALGARPRQVVGMVLGEGTRAAATGVAIGLAVTLLAGGFIAPLLFATSPRDPLVLVSVAATLLLTALLAGLVPAWRAIRVDPAVTLREE